MKTTDELISYWADRYLCQAENPLSLKECMTGLVTELGMQCSAIVKPAKTMHDDGSFTDTNLRVDGVGNVVTNDGGKFIIPKFANSNVRIVRDEDWRQINHSLWVKNNLIQSA